MAKAVGFEDSNSSIKVVCGGRVLHYLNTLQEVNENLLANLMKNNQKIYHYQGKKYIIGSVAGNGSGSKDESRYYSEQFKRETAIALSQVVDSDKENIKLVTGLPASLSERDDLIKKMKKNLIDTYEVTIEYNEYTKERKQFTISDVIIVSQPIGTLWTIIYNTDGTLKTNDKNIKHHKFLLIDIGYGTTDMVELSASKGLGNNKTLNKAMSDYVANLYNAIEREYPESRLSAAIENPYELDKLLVDNDILELPRGKFKVGNIKEKLQDAMAQEIKSSLDKFGYNFEIYHKIILTGGGSKTLEKAIRKVFNNDNRITLVDNPLLANATGFYIIAKQYFKV